MQDMHTGSHDVIFEKALTTYKPFSCISVWCELDKVNARSHALSIVKPIFNV